jgi:hypothetical protein
VEYHTVFHSTFQCPIKPFILVRSISVLTVSAHLTRATVSGSNRVNGIGYALAATLAARPNTIVFAGARDPATQSLKDLAAKHSNVRPISPLVM